MFPRAHPGPIWAQAHYLDGALGPGPTQASEGDLENSEEGISGHLTPCGTGSKLGFPTGLAFVAPAIPSH